MTGPARSERTTSRLSTAFDGIRARHRRRRLQATLAALEEHQLVDLGIARGEIPAYARAAAFAPRLLSAMLARLELDPGGAGCTSRLRDELLRSCRACPNTAMCKRWVVSRGRREGYRAFCPNATLFDRLPRRRAVDP